MRREDFLLEIATISASKIVVIDEAGTNLGMTRTHARCLEGERAFFKCPGNRGGNISLVGAMRLDEQPILYPFDGAVDGERFLAFLDNHLIPKLKEGDVLVMDNCRVHHSKGTLPATIFTRT